MRIWQNGKKVLSLTGTKSIKDEFVDHNFKGKLPEEGFLLTSLLG